MEHIRILHEPSAAEPFLVLDKPAGLPTAPLAEGEECALQQALDLYPALRAVTGRKAIERGLVHRIDTATRGCVLIAATQSAYERLLAAQKSRQFYKCYSALVDRIPDITALLDGFPPQTDAMKHFNATAALEAPITLSSRFRAYGAHNGAVRPVTDESGRAAQKKCAPALYETTITLYRASVPSAAEAQNAFRAECEICAGYRHQVRCHLAWLGFPVHGDELYNPSAQAGERLCFTASALAFPNPVDGRRIEIRLTA